MFHGYLGTFFDLVSLVNHPRRLSSYFYFFFIFSFFPLVLFQVFIAFCFFERSLAVKILTAHVSLLLLGSASMERCGLEEWNGWAWETGKGMDWVERGRK